VQRVWLQVALAALAGLGNLAVCSVALVAIVSLVMSEGHIVWISSSLATTFFWFGLVNAMLFAGASLSLAALAVGARGGHALTTTVLSSLVFGAFVFFFLILDSTVSFCGASHVYGAGHNLGHRFPRCCRRGGRPQRSGSSGLSDRNRGSGDILRFVACLLVGS
jgi:hypothetical protein